MTSESLLVNGVVFFAGGLCGWFVGGYLTNHPAVLNLRAERADRKAERMNTGTENKPRRLDKYGSVIVIFLVVLLAISWQAYASQRNESSRNREARENQAQLVESAKCTSDWGRELVKTVKKRAQANKAVEKAKDARDDAVDHVFDIVILARRIPPEAGVDEFDKALEDYAQAKARLIRVQASADETKKANKYQQLDCVLPETAEEK